MTLSTTTSRVASSGDAVSVDFNFPYAYIAASELKVVLTDEGDGSEATQTLNTHYTVAATGAAVNGVYPGATITFSAAPGTNKKIIIYREPAYTQEFNFTAEADPRLSLNRFADYVMMRLQRLDNARSRSLRLSDGVYSSFDGTLLDPDATEATAGMVPMLKTGLTGVQWGQPLSTTVSSAMTGVVQAATLVLGRAAFGFWSGLEALWTAVTKPAARDALNIPKVFHVMDYGAECDGRTVFDGAIDIGVSTTTLNSATAVFTAEDVGKVVIVARALTDIGLSRRPLVTTIAAYVSATQVTLTDAATRTTSAARLTIGTDDTAAFVAAMAAAAAADGGDVHWTGDTIITATLDNDHDGVRLTSNGYAMSISNFGDDLEKYLNTAPSRMIWGGADTGYFLNFDVGQRADGVWIKRAGNGFHRCIFDGAGRAGGVFQSYSAMALDVDHSTGAHFHHIGIDIGVTDNANFVAVADGGLGEETNVAGGHGNIRMTLLNNFGYVYGAKGMRVWGDQGRGNPNDHRYVIKSAMADSGAFTNIMLENGDTSDLYGEWNGRCVANSSSSGSRSTFNGVMPGYERLAVLANPSVAEAVYLDVGAYTAYVLGGDLTITPTSGGGKPAVLAGNISITDGEAAQLTVTRPGFVTVTPANTPTSWSLTNADGEAVDTPHAPVTQSIFLEVGTWILRVGAGGGTAEVTADSGSATGLAGSGTGAGNSDTFVVTDRGTFDLTITGTVNWASVKMLVGASRTRSFDIDGDGLFLAQAADAAHVALSATAYHSQNNRFRGVIENNNQRPLIAPGATALVEVDAQADNTPGAMRYGGIPLMCEVRLAATQAIANATADVAISWPTPAKDTGGFYNAGDPTKVTIGSASAAHANNNVMACIVFVQATFENNGTGQRFLSIFHNSTEIDCDWETGNASQFTRLNGYAFLLVSPGDVITANVTQSSGGDLNLTNANRGTRMTVICF
jgi:hypothetical protein